MEHEFMDPQSLYYAGAGNFYNPLIQGSLSEIGEQGLSGPGSGQSGNSIDAPAANGGGLSWQSYQNDVKQAYRVGAETFVAFSGVTVGEEPVALTAALTAYVVDFLVNFFEDIFSGGGSPPIPRQLLHGRHPLYAVILGIRKGLISNEASSAPLAGKSPGPKSTGGVPSEESPLRKIQYEVVPYGGEPGPLQESPGFDLDPEAPELLLRQVTFDRCMDAAEHPAIWADLCRDMPNSILKTNCWSLLPESVEMKRGFCKDLFEA
jgi:hypothetical protein